MPLTLTDDPSWVEIYVADDIADRADHVQQLELRLQLSTGVDPDDITIKFNGIDLRPPVVEDGWWLYKLKPFSMATGRNLVMLDISSQRGNHGSTGSLEKLEIHVSYLPE